MKPHREHRRPARLAHLGLGAFHRAHQAWYTQQANRAGGDFGIAAFTGRSPDAARILAAQDSLYTLIERDHTGDRATLMEALTSVHDGNDRQSWRRVLADADVTVLTVTVTEAGYRAGSDVPDRIVDGLRARFLAGAGGIAVVSCDNLPNNGVILRNAVLLRSDPATRFDNWLRSEVSFVSSMVDRITPAATSADREAVKLLGGWDDAAPVVTEPFTEWVLAGIFPSGRPEWEAGGARFVEDITPFERRKLWLLNAGHSLLAYHGLAAGHTTVADAFTNAGLTAELEQLWSEQRAVLAFDGLELDSVLETIRARFRNARIGHHLSQIAMGGADKLGPRILGPLLLRITSGFDPGRAQLGVLAAWVRYLAGPGLADPTAKNALSRLRDAAHPLERAAIVLDVLSQFTSDDHDLTPLIEPLAERIAESD